MFVAEEERLMALMKCPNCKNEVGNNIGMCPTCGYSVWKKKDENYLKKMTDKNIAAFGELKLKRYQAAMELLDDAVLEYSKFKSYLEGSNADVDILSTKCHDELKYIYYNYADLMSKADSSYYNIEEAIAYFEKSGKLGYAQAYGALGCLFDKNNTAFQLRDTSIKDDNKAIEWYKKAIATDGYTTSLNNLGYIYACNQGQYHLGAFYCWCAYQIDPQNTVALNNYNSYLQSLSAEYQKYFKTLVVKKTNIFELESSFLLWHQSFGKNTISKTIVIQNHIKKHKKKYIIGAIAIFLAFIILLIAIAPSGSGGNDSGDTRRCGSCHKSFEKYDAFGGLDDDYSSIQRRGMCEKCYKNHKWAQDAIN